MISRSPAVASRARRLPLFAGMTNAQVDRVAEVVAGPGMTRHADQ